MKSLKVITVGLAVIFFCLSVIPLSLAGEKPVVKIGFIGHVGFDEHRTD